MAQENVAPFGSSIFSALPGQLLVATGAGAAARGAYEAGAGLVVTYPGSPITETFEILASEENPSHPVTHLCVNEHVGFHKAMGFSLCGGRSLITMKHVGFNVAADPAHYIGYTGVKGGMVVLVGTDPGAFCSTGEYDFRFYALHTHLPLLEPACAQETLELMKSAFTWSEEDGLPYVLALPAGTCYGIEGVRAGPVTSLRASQAFVNSPDYTNVGRRAVQNHARLLDKVKKIAKTASVRGFMKTSGPTTDTLILTSGIHFPRVLEALQILGLQRRARVACSMLSYPYPLEALAEVLPGVKTLLFVEDLGGFLETSLSRFLLDRKQKLEVHGKDLFSETGSLETRHILKGLGTFFGQPQQPPCPAVAVPEREGTFCPGCSYRGFFQVLTEFLGPQDVLGGDIGCSSLPPHYSSWLTCMNSGTSIAAGVALASTGKSRVVSLIGDSTLLHSGLQTILEAANTDSDQICFVLDNHWTAMTGHQPTPATPIDSHGKTRPHLNLENLLRSLGVGNISRVDPYSLDNFRSLLQKLLKEKGFRVVLVERECTLQNRRRGKGPGWHIKVFLDPDRCQDCGACYHEFCCPAIVRGAGDSLEIDDSICSQCGVCLQICPNGAIRQVNQRKP